MAGLGAARRYRKGESAGHQDANRGAGRYWRGHHLIFGPSVLHLKCGRERLGLGAYVRPRGPGPWGNGLVTSGRSGMESSLPDMGTASFAATQVPACLSRLLEDEWEAKGEA